MMTYGIVMIVAAVACVIWARRMNLAGNSTMAAYLREFLDRSGYRHVDLREAPIEAQLQRSLDLAQKMSKGDSDTRMLRPYEGVSIYWRQWSKLTGTGYAMGCQWSLPLAAKPRALLHVADRHLVGAGKAVKEFFTSSKRSFTPAYAARTATGDPTFDDRFVVFCVDVQGARHALADVELRAQLLACAEVDLVVAPTELTFSDPSMANQRAMSGHDASTTMLVHDRMANILRRMAATVQ